MTQLLVTIYAGFSHAFETDHLLAVSNIVSQRNSVLKSVKDGLFWGLGHTSTIIFIGVLMLLLKVQIGEGQFHVLEAGVGLMLVLLGMYRLLKLKAFFTAVNSTTHSHNGIIHTHAGFAHSKGLDVTNTGVQRLHFVSYGVGMVHGLAGSGELVLLAMLQMTSPQHGLLYLAIYGSGSVVGMIAAAILFSLPFSKKILRAKGLQVGLIILSSLLCLGFGAEIIYRNFLAI